MAHWSAPQQSSTWTQPNHKGGVPTQQTPSLPAAYTAGTQPSQTVINEYLSNKRFKKIEALILGCTHYPLIEAEIKQFYKTTHQNVFVLNSADVVAHEVKRILNYKNLLSKSLQKEHHFYVSDFTDSFEKSTKIFFGNQLSLEKQNIWEVKI